ncbi:MAG: SRPBCC domain-containing protein [Gammaproteobacteria bacterium]|nr:SRPBCC domain-containing protein [Gammaproteobacteria bacterium]
MSTHKKLALMALVLSQLLITGCSTISIRTAIEIDAPRDEVYQVLANIEGYPEWNPYHRKVEGEFKEGAGLTVYVTRPDGVEVEVPPHMMRIIENEEITWGGGIKGIFYGEHRFLLESTETGTTVLRHDEDFSGFAVGFADLPPEVIAVGYHQMNMALKKRLEQEN